ncbi:MAG: hypothetical protein R3A52_27125 [Polyangiales bacterium]
MLASPLARGVALAGLVTAGCSATVHRPGLATAFDAHPAREVTDDDIRAALAARPQLPERVRVAYFSNDEARDAEVESALTAIASVDGVYRIPPLLVTGRRRFDEPRPWDPPREVGVHALRLLAARARCDALVVFDYGHRVTRSANGYAALNALVVPLFFAPFLDARVESYLDAYVIDVRNGYLYRHVSASQRSEVSTLTVWSDADRRLVATQWTSLLADARRDLAEAFSRGRAPPTAQVAATRADVSAVTAR